MWKAFDELEQMKMIGAKRPKMIGVQAEGCQPIVRAFANGSRFAEEHVGAKTSASGLRVPKAIGDFIILDAIRESGGTAVAVSDDAMISAAKEMSAKTGIFACPEGGACLAAYRKLVSQGFLSERDEVVLFNTASGLKYQEAFAR
jgi:threonine synthase